MNLDPFTIELTSFWYIAVYILVLVIITWLLSRIIRFFLVKYINRTSKDNQYSVTRLKFMKNSVKFFLGLIAFLVVVLTVPIFRSKAAIIFSGAGILAAIIGFAAQAAISNLIAGAFIVLFKPFRVGDFIKLDDLRFGIVEDITLRHTVINTFENKRLIIPNSIISTDSVLNHTIEDSYVLSFTKFVIGIHNDIDKVKAIIKEEALKLPHVIDYRTPEQVIQNKEPIQVRVNDINEIGIYLSAMIWVEDPFKEYNVKSDLRQAVHKRFIAEGISLPIPLRKIIESK